MLAKIAPGASFKENLALLPPITGLSRVELRDTAGNLVDTIENQPGKQGSLAVYAYLAAAFPALDAAAAEHALAVFAEHTPDARARPGAHPNVDRLLAIVSGGAPLQLKVIPADAE
jgi:hypothetical protein